MKKKIYISGKISGLPYEEVVDKFNDAKKMVEGKGHEAVSPLDVSPYVAEKKWEDYMKDDIAVLVKCDEVWVLPDWVRSEGAIFEVNIARKLNIPIVEI